MSALQPVNVSPLIKGARWSFLIGGLIYGRLRYNYLMKKEQRRLDELERTRPEREAKLAEKLKKMREGK
ncbi:ATP synthase e chain, putative [Pediculus humanus corporis]|uniref:ATP synthase F(0) complex subunit e, mitochondrial n=1 Tax=Pediculus humanus subsp. corporis TaxID=121224 RepID=E0VSI6_PEDHC|nr:ATP synthase e chain, putative [Pediculus humanus corporis]EEB16342.1 ATP synthase e chain, putative [Pediculus humanus corporis]